MSGRDKANHAQLAKEKIDKKKKGGNKESAKAGLIFPIGRIRRHLRQGRYAKMIGKGAAIYMAAVLEYMASELLEISGNAAKEFKKKRIMPRHIQLAVRGDEELDKLLEDVTISEGGVIPHINAALMPVKIVPKPREKKAELGDDAGDADADVAEKRKGKAKSADE